MVNCVHQVCVRCVYQTAKYTQLTVNTLSEPVFKSCFKPLQFRLLALILFHAGDLIVNNLVMGSLI